MGIFTRFPYFIFLFLRIYLRIWKQSYTERSRNRERERLDLLFQSPKWPQQQCWGQPGSEARSQELPLGALGCRIQGPDPPWAFPGPLTGSFLSFPEWYYWRYWYCPILIRGSWLNSCLCCSWVFENQQSLHYSRTRICNSKHLNYFCWLRVC